MWLFICPFGSKASYLFYASDTFISSQGVVALSDHIGYIALSDLRDRDPKIEEDNGTQISTSLYIPFVHTHTWIFLVVYKVHCPSATWSRALTGEQF